MGIYLSIPITDKSSEDGENGTLRYGLSSMQGWRSSMEDAHAAYPELDSCTSFFGVYDGHGGKEVAKFCAKHMHDQLLNSEAYSSGDLGAALRKAFLRMDEMMCGQRGWRELATLGDKLEKVTSMIDGFIRRPRSSDVKGRIDDRSTEEEPHSDYAGPTSGSTACVAVVQNNVVVVANAGDSRCVLSRSGQAFELSKDHKPDLEIEKDRILNAGGFVQCGRVNGSLNLSRAIGDMEMKQNRELPAEKQMITAYPDVTTIELQDDDEFLVLACDGIWDCLTSQQLVDFLHEQLKTENKLSAVCEKVLDTFLAPAAGGEGCDNMTMILVQFKKPNIQDAPSETDPTPSDKQAESIPKEGPTSSETDPTPSDKQAESIPKEGPASFQTDSTPSDKQAESIPKEGPTSSETDSTPSNKQAESIPKEGPTSSETDSTPSDKQAEAIPKEGPTSSETDPTPSDKQAESIPEEGPTSDKQAESIPKEAPTPSGTDPTPSNWHAESIVKGAPTESS